MNTSKKGVRLIALICRQKGIRKVVFSPGSRSAPLVIAFSQIPEIECIVIPDERVAGYFALGIAQQLGETVAVVCTSGTAVLNLSPAVCEAYYQRIPLLIITADRPDSAESNGENQAIKQEDAFINFAMRYSVNGDAKDNKTLTHIAKLFSQLIDNTRNADPMVGHLNVQIDEPLYNLTPESFHSGKLSKQEKKKYRLKSSDVALIKKTFNALEKKMIIVGMRGYDDAFSKKLQKLNQRKDTIVIHENISNTKAKNSVWNIDSCISQIKNENDFIPDIVITLGNQIVSKKLKQFLKNKPQIHWDVPPLESRGRGWAIFGDMMHSLEPSNETQFLETILALPEKKSSGFKKNWMALSEKAEEKSQQYFSKIPFTDLKVFKTLLKSFPDNANIQYGNSTPIRYSNLFEHKNSLTVNANRGTSGIDGCLSTAAGAAYVNNQMTICIVGDVSFFYDSNSLWNNYLSPDFRIIIINNGGGNIFRLIDGPTKVKDFEKFFETKHNLTAKHLASMYDLPYYICDSQQGLDKILKTFYKPQKGKPAILEIKTDGKLSADVYKKYFEYLRQTEK